jgi:hemerythrin superfamily protein
MCAAQVTDIRSGNDVVSFLKQQHDQIKTLFQDVLSSSGDERKDAFVRLRRLLAVHETAEEEIVHPRAKSVLSDGDSVVGDRLEEENKAKQVLAELESIDVDSPQFESAFRAFQADVLEHAESEEKFEFAQLADALDEAELGRMQTAARAAEAMAPTRPHPGVESKSANMLAGPFAAMLDRARDVLSGKSKNA